MYSPTFSHASFDRSSSHHLWESNVAWGQETSQYADVTLSQPLQHDETSSRNSLATTLHMLSPLSHINSMSTLIKRGASSSRILHSSSFNISDHVSSDNLGLFSSLRIRSPIRRAPFRLHLHFASAHLLAVSSHLLCAGERPRARYFAGHLQRLETELFLSFASFLTTNSKLYPIIHLSLILSLQCFMISFTIVVSYL